MHISQAGRKGSDRVCHIRTTAVDLTTFNCISDCEIKDLVLMHKHNLMTASNNEYTKSHEQNITQVDILEHAKRDRPGAQYNDIYAH